MKYCIYYHIKGEERVYTMMGSRTSWGGVSVRVLVTELNHKDLGSVLYWYISQSPMSPCVYGEDKRGQEWTRGDKRGQEGTRGDKRGREGKRETCAC